ncbi:hypothetical protein HN858_03395 [Candidatus Falkowbacteria bacterium]|mgnify:CR=1 FL=1|jgi:hypothetical protein|nr:hypothetical protein [Candidatus Falkowbacteria bacterium]MBT5502669.1 hypothetical protein [Candidatus Falkowbacteria bacterium]MBT6574159.1 hypothetical protein [Candidatus Falkowbacteria bacterium]MBT7348694.1 hypothetical protein [Candidatus Falkowbacteria bacterium]MBT7500484.1 hypothetical protein [Candidatus Falkowbacteria bacterium]
MEQSIVEPAVSWFSLSLIIAGIAQGKNRDGFGCWLFGLFTGPFALFCLVALAPKLDEASELKE